MNYTLLHITLTEKKTGKQKRFPLCNGLLKEMERYTKNLKVGEYLFKSRKGDNKPITTVQAYRIISEAAKKNRFRRNRTPHNEKNIWVLALSTI